MEESGEYEGAWHMATVADTKRAGRGAVPR